MNTCSTILFDLGGVIIDLDYSKTIDAFKELGVANFDEKFSQANQTPIFDDYETGKISSQQFINGLLTHLELNVSPNKVVHAWNAMILDIQMERLKFVEALKAKHRIAVLSNTNEIHIQKVDRIISKKTDKRFKDFFEVVYLSHEIGHRKPHPKTFQYVCNQLGEQPEDVLFIEDSIQHIEGAKSIGMQTIHHPTNASFFDYFS